MRHALALVLACLAGPALAADVAVTVHDAHGMPVSDAVVTLDDGGARAAAHAATHEVDQRDEAFHPYVSVLRPGDSVVFRNSDTTRHHVYSFSAAKAFEQLLAPGAVGAPLRVERAGLVAVGCNIHDHMRAWLVVSAAPWVAVSDAAGVARFAGLPAGGYRSVVWHPQLRPRQPEIANAVALDAAATVRELPVSLRLLPDPRVSDPHHSGY